MPTHIHSSRHLNQGGAKGWGACGEVGCSWWGVSDGGKCFGWGHGLLWGFGDLGRFEARYELMGCYGEAVDF